jgi:uncharacterized protein YdeI (YjbR/CyaY-like superfamily)
MNKIETLRVTTRKDWRSWLQKHFNTEKEVWLVYPKKSSGKERIIYNDAVEEALCFGWIDSTVKSLDEDHTIQRFSPRKTGSTYSQQNKERIKWLLEHDMIHPSVLDEAKKIASEKFVFPKDIIETIKKDKEVRENYDNFSDTYKRIRIAYIDAARKRPEEFKKRLNNFIAKTKDNKQIGFGGIEKYY